MEQEKEKHSPLADESAKKNMPEACDDGAQQELEPLKEIQDGGPGENAERISANSAPEVYKGPEPEGSDSRCENATQAEQHNQRTERDHFKAAVDDGTETDQKIPDEDSVKAEQTDHSQITAPTQGPGCKHDKEENRKSLAATDHTDEYQSAVRNDHDHPNAVNGRALKEDKSQKKRCLSKLTLAVVLILVLAAGFFVQTNRKKADLRTQLKVLDYVHSEIDPARPLSKASGSGQKDPEDEYRRKFDDIIRLRDMLLVKQDEVFQLIQQYREGVEILENETLYEMLDKGIDSYEQALKSKRIELGLRTIQRRLAYIQALDRPLQWLNQGSEELLYLKRSANFDLQMISVASGIDMQLHMNRINAAMQTYRLTAEKLAIEIDNSKLAPLDEIWKRLNTKVKNNPQLQTDLNNWMIQREICAGDLKRTRELSNISIDAAKCIPKIKGTDLFLNNLTELSPMIAKQLGQWQGKWICLNGVRELSPSAAQYLFQWQGEWISLNGLCEFPQSLAEHLMHWKGKQLELMGLEMENAKTEQIAIKTLAAWERSGGKLFVPEQIRKKIDRG